MKKIIYSALALLALASCSKNDETSFATTDSEVRISSSIATRTVSNTWENDDEIGVYMTTYGGTFGGLGKNVLYTNSANDFATATFGSDSPLYYPASDNVNLLAYYPYDVDTDNSTNYPVDVTTQTDQGAIDLMRATATDIAKSTSAVDMTFSHMLSRISLTIEADGSVAKSDLKGLVVTLSGTATEGVFCLMEGFASPTNGSTADITMLTAADGLSSEAIVIPQTLSSSATLTFTTADNTYTTTLPTKEFVVGDQYEFTVTIKDTGIAISSATINPWGNGTEGTSDLTAEPVEPDIAFVNGTYQIGTAAGLQAFASIVNNSTTDVSKLNIDGISDTTIDQNASANCLLMNDIDLSTVCSNGGTTWEPIGYSDNAKFSGVFDGGGNSIKNYYFSYTDDTDNDSSLYGSAGLFGYVSGASAVIKNVEIVKGFTFIDNVDMETHAAILVGTIGDGATLLNCGCDGDSSVELAQIGAVGGLIGFVDSGRPKILNCYNKGYVYSTITSTTGTVNIGGLCGIVGNTGTTLYINNCYNSGSVTKGRSSNYAIGSLVGANGDRVTFANSYYLTDCAGSGVLVDDATSSDTDGLAREGSVTPKSSDELQGLTTTLDSEARNINGASVWKDVAGGYPVFI